MGPRVELAGTGLCKACFLSELVNEFGSRGPSDRVSSKLRGHRTYALDTAAKLIGKYWQDSPLSSQESNSLSFYRREGSL
jgi:hypothetical protein